jgi:chorismate mutase-like protein
MAEGMTTAAERLEELRRAIAALDSELVDLLARRLRLATEIGEIKKELGLPVLDPAREAEVVRRGAALARERGVDPELVRDLLWRIIAQARGVQDAHVVRGHER